MTKINRRTVLYVLIATILICALAECIMPAAVAAQSSINAFDKIDIMDDLQDLAIDGKLFDPTNFPYNEARKPEILTVMEYCYSPYKNKRSNYALYVYLYNPSGAEIRSGRIQIDAAKPGELPNYDKFELRLCSVSKGAYSNLYYKYKVIDRVINGSTFADRVNTLRRDYNISGIDLTDKAGDTIDCAVKHTYTFTGYAAGYGADENAASTLVCTSNELDTIELSVRHTFYRTKTSIKGAGYQNQIDTAYFTVPKRYLDTYGKLQKIKAEWWEYKTRDIVVTSEMDFYNTALPYVGVATNPNDSSGIPEYNANIGYSLGQDAGRVGEMNVAKWGWNLGKGYLHPAIQSLYYLFDTKSIESYDPLADLTAQGGVSSNRLYDYIRSYNKTYDQGRLPIKDGSISADLFCDDIDDYRKTDDEFGRIQQGYCYYDFDADLDVKDLTSWQDSDPGFWDNWINWGLWDAIWGNIPQEDSRQFSPIHVLSSADLSGTNEQVSDRLLINYNDVPALRDLAAKSASKDDEEVVILFRFATTDYYSAPIDIIQIGKILGVSDKHISGKAYRAWESVFFDFDIIQLTFLKNGKYKVIPVVSDPIDIVNAITPPIDMPDPDGNLPWWAWMLIGIAVLIVLLVLLSSGLLDQILYALIWMLTLPFRLLYQLFHWILSGIVKDNKPKFKNNKRSTYGKKKKK